MPNPLQRYTTIHAATTALLHSTPFHNYHAKISPPAVAMQCSVDLSHSQIFPSPQPGPEDAKTTASILAGVSHKRREIGPVASCESCVASPCVPHVAWELAWSASPTRPFAARVLDADAERRWGGPFCYMWHGARGSTSMSVRNRSAARNRSPAVIWPL
jgi:hypothetical protein